MAIDPSFSEIDDETRARIIEFVTTRHLATLTTLRRDGSPHVCPVGFSYDVEARVARVITWAAAQKAVNAGRMEAAGQRAAVCQVDGGRWLTFEGPVRLVTDRDAIVPGVEGYRARYRDPKDRDDRVVIEIDVDKILGRP
ncbi:MAG: pyridoxamine 5'-phosphate oxidase family protein [Actinomycetota bacterium]